MKLSDRAGAIWLGGAILIRNTTSITGAAKAVERNWPALVLTMTFTSVLDFLSPYSE
jgi:hypothetical protein